MQPGLYSAGGFSGVEDGIDARRRKSVRSYSTTYLRLVWESISVVAGACN